MKIILTTLMICMLISNGRKQLNHTIAHSTAIDTPDVAQKLSAADVEKILDEYLPKVEACAQKDSIFYPLGNTAMEDDSSRLIAIGRFIDGKMINAVDISSPDDGVATFYAYRGHKWESIGQYPIQGNVYDFDFADYDGDNQNEIKTRGIGNMNGNYSNYFFSYSDKENKVKYAGDFFSGEFQMETRDGEKQINVNLEGSWYMDGEQTVYRWRDGKLLPVKQVVLSLKNPDYKHHAHWITYYENPTKDKDTLVLRFRKTFRERDKKLNNLWEHFFD